jgi:hypothetical protein
MWSITAAHLAGEFGHPPTNQQISASWRTMIDLNEDRVRSGNVDLIFAGETLLLPIVEG